VWGKNTTGSAITKGTAVMATGTLGASGIITVAPMDGTLNANAMYLIGVAGADIPADGEGDIVALGKVRGFDTTAWNEGQVLWISPTTAGALTNVEPSLGQLKMPVAFVVTDHHTNGEIMVRVTPIDESRFEEFTWSYLKDTWTVEPSITASITGGDVYSYTLKGVTRYRFVPTTSPYDATLDAFYTTFTGGVLSGLIATKG
jgi:hypothetical protein